ncbi:hypothetical protein MKY31_30685 [Bacillus sp. FSL M8-0139]|uniref:hypothetical protein n=1 Tax=Bacillus sp. FSL M8-0139 TaxID=2921613 RepID=UPI0030F87F81
MNDLAKELNETFQKYQIGPHEIAYWMYLTLERMTEDHREMYEQRIYERRNGTVRRHSRCLKRNYKSVLVVT